MTADYIGDTDLIYQLEETLAEACLTKVERRDPNVMYNPHNLEQLVAVCPAIDWAEYLSDVNIDLKGTFCVVKEIEFMKRLVKSMSCLTANKYNNINNKLVLSSLELGNIPLKIHIITGWINV